MTRMAALVVGAALLFGSSADAKWTQITHQANGGKPNLGLARTSDGTLHVLSAGPNRLPYSALFDTPISPKGAIGTAQTIVSGWEAIHPPDAVVAPDGSIHLVDSGAEKLGPQEPHDGLNEMVGPGAWTVGAQAFGTASITEADNADLRVDILPSGEVVSVWQSGLQALMQVGTNPATPPQSVQPPGSAICCPDVAVDRAGGDAFIVYSQDGYDWFRQILPAMQAPVKIAQAPSPGYVPGVTPGLGGGLYTTAISPGFKTVKLVKLGGQPKAVPVPRRSGDVVGDGVAAGPEGRLWVFFGNQQNTFVTRTNKAVTAYEPVQRISNPKGVAQYFRMEGEGSQGPLDLFTNLTIDGAAKDGTYATHVLPRLSLSLSTKALKKGGHNVTARVTDAGDPVAGAKVSGLPGGAKTTGASGAATFITKATGGFTIRAATAGYVAAKARLSL